MKSQIDPGDEVICPGKDCNMSILVCKEKPVLGSNADWFTWFDDDGWGGKKGDRCICPICEEAWMVWDTWGNAKIHVKDKGWII